KIFNFDENNVIVHYCKYFLKTSKMMFEYEQCSDQGASVVRRNLNIDLFLNIPARFPSLQEQKTIVSFLSSIEEKIETEKGILKQLENQKQYLLQSLFI
ncbi:MAG: restriction endonuclease subunit S, partial [Chryseobacterium sp.]